MFMKLLLWLRKIELAYTGLLQTFIWNYLIFINNLSLYTEIVKCVHTPTYWRALSDK
jgi:hypothetical protein